MSIKPRDPFLLSSCKFLGDLDKFDDFRSSVKGHHRQQQASYLFNKEFMRQYNIIGAEWYRHFLGLISATQESRDVETLYGDLQTACKREVAKKILL